MTRLESLEIQYELVNRLGEEMLPDEVLAALKHVSNDLCALIKEHKRKE